MNRPRHPDAVDLKVVFVLEVDLSTMSPRDAADQVAAIGRKLSRFRDRELKVCRSLRIAVDEPAGEKVATRLLRYLDDAEARLPRPGNPTTPPEPRKPTP